MPPDLNPALQGSASDAGVLWSKVAGELERLREDLEDIGASLCMDDNIVTRHMTLLQRLDELGQRSCWLAELVRADDPVARVEDITLYSLMERLKA